MGKRKIFKIVFAILSSFFMCGFFMNCSESALHIKSSRKCPIQPKKETKKMGHGTNAVKIQNGQ